MKLINLPVQGYIHKLDVLRGMAIVLVFFYHAQLCVYPNFEKIEYERIIWNINSESLDRVLLNCIPTAFGATGVWLFLVISGFLIHYSYLQKVEQTRFNLLNFFHRRFWRIYPPYLLALLVFSFSAGGVNYLITEKGLIDLVSHLFLVQNLNEDTYFSINPSMWSLALECQLYALYPLFLYMRNKIGVEKTVGAITLIACIWTAFVPSFESKVLEHFVLRYWFIWAGGAFVAERYMRSKQTFKFHGWWLTVLISLLLGSKFFVVFRLVSPFISALIYLIIIDIYLWSKKPVGSYEKFLSPIGVVSYSLYLIHQPFLEAILMNVDFVNASTRISWIFKSFDAIIVFLLFYLIAYSLYHNVEIKSVMVGNIILERWPFAGYSKIESKTNRNTNGSRATRL